MKHGFVKVAAATPDIKVADCTYNAESVCRDMKKAAGQGAKIVVFPELCLTGYTCSDLFWQEHLLDAAKEGLKKIIKTSLAMDGLFFVGLPWEVDQKLYNVAAAVSQGELLGLVPKRYLPNYAEFYEARHFTPGREDVEWVTFDGHEVPFGMNQLFHCADMPGLTVAAEICEDLWVPNPPSVAAAMAGATVIVNLSASNENTGKSLYRTALIQNQSARLICGYLYASAGEGESTTDLVFSGHNLIAENGTILKQSQRFQNEIIYSELDIHKLRSERRRMTTYQVEGTGDYCDIEFHLKNSDTNLTRYVDPNPFVPSDKSDRECRCEEILTIQALGLKKRMSHTGCKSVVVGISGGLDSTLALLVMAKAVDMLGLPRTSILSVTMPCFGTTDRTYNNACELTRKLGATLKEVNIQEAVRKHFVDIGQDPAKHDVTYENCQARERTQVLMDLANQSGGMVIGTGDLSELALGWATYNGDHMSMYAVNTSIPKTLIRHLVKYYGEIGRASCRERV